MAAERPTCKDCGQDFPSNAALDKHKAKTCAKRAERLLKEGMLIKG